MECAHRGAGMRGVGATLARAIAALALVAGLAACVYDVPLTTSATRKVDPRLVGDWASDDGKETLKVRPLDATTYLLILDGEPFRGWHSDFSGVSLVTVQDLDRPSRKYAYLRYTLSDDGARLTAHAVNADTIPATVRSSSEARRAIRDHLDDPRLYNDDPLELKRQK